MRRRKTRHRPPLFPDRRQRFVPERPPAEPRNVVTPAEAERRGVWPLDRIVEIARRYPDEVMVLPLLANLVDLARANDKVGDGTARVRIPDSLVVNLRGEPELRDLLFLVHIPRRLVDIGESRIVLPQEVSATAQPQNRRRR